MVIEVESKNLDTVKDGNVLVDFYTSTCGPCKALQPVLEEISNEFDNQLKVAKIELTKTPEASQMFGVMSVPTVMFLKNSKILDVSYGFSNRDSIRSMVSKHLSNG